MSERTGLSRVAVALLHAVDLRGEDEPVRCSEVLAAVAALEGLGPRHTWPMLVDLGVLWRRHLPLVELYGNCGTVLGRPAAAPQHVEARLSPFGRVALAAERRELGPVPLGLVEGSWAADGPVPPFDPDAVVGALLAGREDAGPPSLPGGGTVEGDLDALLAGDEVSLTVGCTIRPEAGHLVITEIPLGIDGGRIVDAVSAVTRLQYARGRPALRVRRQRAPVIDVRDESTSRDGVRIVLLLDQGSDLLVARDWLRGIWPVTVERSARLPMPMRGRLASWHRGDGSGLRALRDLLTPAVPPPGPLAE